VEMNAKFPSNPQKDDQSIVENAIQNIDNR
jgi:hypothetical protein